VTTRTLFIWGENDGIVTPAYGRTMAKHVPGSSLVTIPQAGHYPHVEQLQAFMGHLRKFLG
jgi:pimeloyl-ACP methyl ester carboxylesterase